MILIYIDNIIIDENSSHAIQHAIRSLHFDFLVKELSDLSYFLGVKVLRLREGMHLTQRKYVADLLKRTHMA